MGWILLYFRFLWFIESSVSGVNYKPLHLKSMLVIAQAPSVCLNFLFIAEEGPILFDCVLFTILLLCSHKLIKQWLCMQPRSCAMWLLLMWSFWSQKKGWCLLDDVSLNPLRFIFSAQSPPDLFVGHLCAIPWLHPWFGDVCIQVT